MDPAALAEFVRSTLYAARNPEKAVLMAAYMKTSMPFYGVQKPRRAKINKEMRLRFRPGTRNGYEEGIRALWQLPHREEKYTALEFALQHKEYITFESLVMYEYLIRDGAWWDFVDLIASDLVGRILLVDRLRARPVLDDWIEDENLWIRRAAILSQLRHRESTDPDQLFGYCLKRIDEKEFFIRKAIGWALREYSKSAPDAVLEFLSENRGALSGLSYREGAKHLKRSGAMG